MKRPGSPATCSPAKSPKLVHHSPDDVEADENSYILPCSPRDDGLFCLPVSGPPLMFDFGPVPVTAELARKQQKYLADAWDLLKPAIKIILDDKYDKSKDINCRKIYNAVERACFGDPGKLQLQLFDLIEQECEPHVSAVMQSLERQSSDLSVFLPLVYKSWLDFKRKMMFLSDLAMYQRCDGITLWSVCQKLFHKQLSMSPQLQDRVISGILGLITEERLRKIPYNTDGLLKKLMDMFRGVSKDVFAKPFLDSTSKFYAEEAEQVLQESDISQYLKYVEESLLAEKTKCKKHYFFVASCWSQLLEDLGSRLLKAHAGFLEEGFKLLMDESLMDDIRRMYCIFAMVDLVDDLDSLLKSYILAKGKGARQEGSLRELHTSIEKIWRQCFQDDYLLDKTIRDCFESMGLHVPGEFSDEEQRECMED
ncbi:hypothetical protein CARUB_v10001036mg [Capsella rubella]|uniref:Cullin N-terminal domain-containing protein n=1 Tax=Capsella rubella TaxID=81985 RepID=R0FFJ7_9BRAS|nr:cullin-like protein 5 [Capsella rubella]EOA20716.1 hypothetical protein CARUB_v10001036mg [Capsella rubella]